MSAEYHDGWDSFFQGITENPYPHGSQANNEWQKGFDAAQDSEK